MSNGRFSFDKFVDRFLNDDEKKLQKRNDFAEGNAESPARRLDRLYRERWQNRIRWRR